MRPLRFLLILLLMKEKSALHPLQMLPQKMGAKLHLRLPLLMAKPQTLPLLLLKILLEVKLWSQEAKVLVPKQFPMIKAPLEAHQMSQEILMLALKAASVSALLALV